MNKSHLLGPNGLHLSNRFSKTVRCALRGATTSIPGDAQLAATAAISRHLGAAPRRTSLGRACAWGGWVGGGGGVCVWGGGGECGTSGRLAGGAPSAVAGLAVGDAILCSQLTEFVGPLNKSHVLGSNGLDLSNRFSKTVRWALRSATTSILGDARFAGMAQP